MSELNNNPDNGPESFGADGRGVPARSASVQLRGEETGPHGASMMDPANQSLAEALRITYRLLQWAMVVLVVLYIGSGFQSIKTSERGVRLLFGRIAAKDLKPGFQFAWPYPFGELVKVDVGNKNLALNRQFWPYTEPGKEDTAVENLRGSASLNVSQDGSLLTGDGAIAHTQWTVQYVRDDASAYAQNVYPEHETGIIRAAVQRGVVQAIAEVSIDDLLKQSARDADSVAIRARSIARETLEQPGIPTGLEIDQLSLDQKIPPVYLRDSFNGVLQATSNASKAREQATKEGNTLLSDTAGGAATLLISLIDRYEREIDQGEEDRASETLAKIDAVFDGRPVEIDGETVQPSLGGEVYAMLSQSVEYRTAVVDKARSDLTVFQAKLEQFRKSPAVMVTADWTSAVSGFYNDDRVEIFFQPAGTDTLELVTNSDPEIVAERERRMLEERNQKARDERLKAMDRSRYETQEGLRTIPN